MLLPILEYGDIFMMSTTMETRKKLKTLQIRALKCALGKDKRYSTIAIDSEAKLDKLKLRRKQHLLQHLYISSHNGSYQGWKSSRTNIVTRQSKKKLMKTIKPNTTKFRNSLAYKGPRAWNKLPLILSFKNG